MIDFCRLSDADLDAMETIVKENQMLKQQLYTCYMKVAKTQKVQYINFNKNYSNH